jgi:hypothetical protein
MAPIIPVLLAAHKIYKGAKVAKKISPAVKAYIKKKKKLALQESKIKSHSGTRYGPESPLFRQHTRQTFGPKKKPMGKKGMEKLKKDRVKIEKESGLRTSENLTISKFDDYRLLTPRTSSMNFGGTRTNALAPPSKFMTNFVREHRAIDSMKRRVYKQNLNLKKLESLKRMADSKKTKWLNNPSNYLNK